MNELGFLKIKKLKEISYSALNISDCTKKQMNLLEILSIELWACMYYIKKVILKLPFLKNDIHCTHFASRYYYYKLRTSNIYIKLLLCRFKIDLIIFLLFVLSTCYIIGFWYFIHRHKIIKMYMFGLLSWLVDISLTALVFIMRRHSQKRF